MAARPFTPTRLSPGIADRFTFLTGGHGLASGNQAQFC